MHLSSIAKLPRQLKSLTLRLSNLIDLVGDENEFFSVFPPHLRHLDIGALSKPTIMNYLPPDLQILRLTCGPLSTTFRWKASKIPKGLIDLSVHLEDCMVDLDVPYPSTLEVLDFSAHFKNDGSVILLEEMPRGLKFIDLIILRCLRRQTPNNDDSMRQAIFKRFQNLEKVVSFSDADLPYLPERLKELTLNKPQPIDCVLPSRLTNLTIFFTIPTTNLPSTLRKLVMGSLGNLSTAFPFSPWTVDDVAQLVSKVRLEEFNVDMSHFQSASSLSPLSKCETLKNFQLRRIELGDMLETPNWLPRCLPKDINILRLEYEDTSPRMRVWETEPLGEEISTFCVSATCAKSLHI